MNRNKIQNCPICLEMCEQRYLETYFDKVPQIPVKYDLFECSSCGAQYWDPLKNPGSDRYEKNTNYGSRNTDPILFAGLQHQLTMKVLKNFKKEKSPTLIDVGCGNGNFINYARTFGFDCTGIDFDRDGIESGKKVFGFEKMFVDDICGFKNKNPDKKYNVVTFFDVFEHIDNHNEFIETVKNMLEKDGVIALSLPYKDCARWLIPLDYPPIHLTRWNTKTVSNFLENHGFEIIKSGGVKATLNFLVMRLRWKYGKYFNLGLVKKIKQKEFKESYVNQQGKISYIPQKSLKVKFVHMLAIIKDYVLFGIPASIIYLALLPTNLRYTDQFIVAKIKN